MPTFSLDLPWWEYLLWNLGAFGVSLLPHSIMEWIAHRFVLHSKAIVRFAYDEHDQSHHKVYLADESFEMPGFDYGVDFHVRDWFLFLAFTVPGWAVAEHFLGKPILIGTSLSVVLWLHTFNVVHRHFHAPNGSWIERTCFFRFLKRHHREHHRDPKRNFNVAFLPFADLLFGTYSRGK